MKIIDRIAEALGLYEEEEMLEEEQAEKKEPKQNSGASLFSRKNNDRKQKNSEEVAQGVPKAKGKSFFGRKNKDTDGDSGNSRTIALPLVDKQVKVVVIEPTSFDDSQKIADYLRNNQPVVVNFESTDNIITKRMTDFVSGTIYALGGSMKKIGRTILVCAPKNVDIDAKSNIYDEKGGQPWDK
ncbi:MAG: cell division protein SepF [Phascolarctobacterium sp.]|nr:cell division protein SepF [Phascolarctobacterium sp.]